MEDGSLDEAPIWSDVRTFRGIQWRGKVDIIAGGYPCQPFSCAGKQEGAGDPRHLWPAIKRIVEDVRPSLCFFENVPNHLNLGFREVCEDLWGMGFGVEAGIFSAEEVGAPHLRKRLFILAHTDRRGREELGLEASAGLEGAPGDELDRCGNLWPPGPDGDWSGIPEDAQPAIRRVAHGAAHRVDRHRALGNAVVPAVAAKAFTELSRRI
jgi:DNA (cytosine-5)-methyltransferase 1